ncbi:NADH dehydrogenase [ubiquinone] 1 alpha subcomplex subunit 12 [Arabidopsis suecica]|uniref:NADH dehydrogenase [ubiquinone] 1 alpha subcomplex subunit 12 n=1 Tax=Arabidopsis suecica TaxID=45249 RepID=A0A8T1YJB6_ARASU|nr:NADH dehydrogenase [ubiquinone] 1 alpha subcomplex subunit 12 [Arabidopsis suecica]
MSRLWARFAGLFSSKSFIGVDKTGNKYFSRMEEIDGLVKEKRWVVFRREEDPTSIPVEWICWLNGQRKRAPTPEEMVELEARRERVKLNVALLKKEEEEKKAREGTGRKITIGKVDGPDLTSFVRQFPPDSKGGELEEASEETDKSRAKEHEPEIVSAEPPEPKTTEPSGSGSSFRPGTWQPPS